MPSLKSESALTSSLTRALISREDRWIRRRLPDPANSPSPTSPFTDFNSNDYLSLSSSPTLRSNFLQKLSSAPHVLGSGGSRLLVNGRAHAELEERLQVFFKSEKALLFNSGFDANVGFFSCVPQEGDVVLFDEYIHASVHDGMRASRIPSSSRVSFAHNCIGDFRRKLTTLRDVHPGLRAGKCSLFVAMVDILEEVFPLKNGYMVVDEAHATGIYGPRGRGRVAELGLEERVLVPVLLTTELIRDYLLNYARSLIYTTSLSYANIVAAGCSFDLLEDGTAGRVWARKIEDNELHWDLTMMDGGY
ncbi:pyridoxal phosphate-dependent transferase [Cyathus striatus]|nr:pyridoxal phosphate-dependent transferase [Cyathus striatus]